MGEAVNEMSRESPEDGDDDTVFFRCIGLFSDVPVKELRVVRALMRKEQFAGGEVILREGEATNDLLIVRSGKVEVFVNKGTERRHITDLGAGSYFGEMSVFDDYPRSANVAAVTDVVTLRIDRDAFRGFLRANPSALYQMCAVFSHRLRNTNSALARH